MADTLEAVGTVASMTDQEWPTHCPTCGTKLESAVIDLDETNEARAEMNPGEMVAVDYCPNPDCPTNHENA
jgi:hypothetical protein